MDPPDRDAVAERVQLTRLAADDRVGRERFGDRRQA
jgi:hypothetical protein